MNYGGAMTDDIGRLLALFRAHCGECETLDWLRNAASDKEKWKKAHAVFGQIRNKTLKAERKGDDAAQAQYLFEEICAKTVYNLSGATAPFDADSPYRVLPNALAFAHCAGIPDVTLQGKQVKNAT